MRRIAFTLPPDRAEEAVDALVPLLPRGVHERALADGSVEVSFYEHAADAPRPRARSSPPPAPASSTSATSPTTRSSAAACTAAAGRWPSRLRVRSPDDAPGDGTLPELVIESAAGAFGTGAHPTTRMCLELLLALEPGGPFADLGCGAGTLAIAAARLGWEPVLAVDHEPQSVAATQRNADRNGDRGRGARARPAAVAPPPAPTLAANVPPPIHAHVAAALAPAVIHVIVSGFVESEHDEVVALYAAAGFVRAGAARQRLAGRPAGARA